MIEISDICFNYFILLSKYFIIVYMETGAELYHVSAVPWMCGTTIPINWYIESWVAKGVMYSFFPQIIGTWNALPASVVEAPTLVSFKQGLSALSF